MDTDEERVMHSKSDYIEIMIDDKADEGIEEIFLNIKLVWNHLCKAVILAFIVF